MAARAESILAAIETLLDGTTDAGANVQRGQVYAHEETKLPAIAIFMGPDVPAGEMQTGFTDWDLTVLIQTTVSIAAWYTDMSAAVETSLNALREQIHALLLADHTLGLSYVIDTTAGPAEQPIIDGDGELPVGSQILQFVVRYRASFSDIGA